MRAGYGKSTRAFFTKHNPIKILDLGSGIFESATVDNNILFIQKTANQNRCLAIDLSKSKGDIHYDELQFNILTELSANSWTITSDIEQRIKFKIESKGKPLKDWGCAN